MQSLQRWTTRLAVIGAVALVWLQPQAAHAETCYDAAKNVVPCPKSGYVLTQEALKAAGPSATPVPDTATWTPIPPTATYTSTPVPPTATSTETQTPVPAVAAAIPPPPPTDTAPPETPPLLWLGILAIGGLGAGSILLTQSRRRRNGGGKPAGTPGAGGTGPAQMLSHQSDAPVATKIEFEEIPDPSSGPVRVGWMGIQHPVSPDQLHTYDINGVSSEGTVVMRNATTGAFEGSRGGWTDQDGKYHALSADAQDDFIKKAFDTASDNPGSDLSQADEDAGRDKQDILMADLSQADLDASQDKRDILAGNDNLTDKTILTPVDQEWIEHQARREGGDYRQKEGAPVLPGGGGAGRGTGGSIPGSGDGDLSGHGKVVSSTPSTGSTGGGGKKETGGDGGGGGKKETGGDGGGSGKKETGGDGGGDSSDDGDGKKPLKEVDEGMPDPDGGGGDGNTSGRSPFRPGQAPSRGSEPDTDIERPGGLGRVGQMGGGPGQTGGRSTGEPDLDTHSGGDIGAAHPGMGGRLAPSEGVGTDTGDPIA
jgi:hypothetical protein